MVPTQPQCLVLGALYSCLVLDLLWVSYSLGKNGIKLHSDLNVPNLHVGGDWCGILSAQLKLQEYKRVLNATSYFPAPGRDRDASNLQRPHEFNCSLLAAFWGVIWDGWRVSSGVTA